MISELWNELLECIYPSSLYCISCRKIIDDSRTYRLCNECMDNIKWATGRTCGICGKPLSANNPGDTCYHCKQHKHCFDRGYTCAEYGANERAIVFAMKYDNRPDIALTIGDIMADRMLNLYEPDELAGLYDLLVPVPVSKERRKLRGYNQAALIAEQLSKRTGLSYEGEILERINETAKMKGLTPDQRRENIRGCFAISRAESILSGLSCLIIDDIYTTGATVDEVAAVLKQAGAARVDFLSFANGADMIKTS